MSRWTTMIETRVEPYCPSCTCDLMQDAVHWLWGMAVCPTCVRLLKHSQLELLAKMFREGANARHTTTHRGLLLWTPQGPVHPKVSPLVSGSLDPAMVERPMVDYDGQS